MLTQYCISVLFNSVHQQSCVKNILQLKVLCISINMRNGILKNGPMETNSRYGGLCKADNLSVFIVGWLHRKL